MSPDRGQFLKRPENNRNNRNGGGAGENIIDKVVGSYQDFTSFEVGQGKLRPGANTPYLEYRIPNLALAGDWVSAEYPCALMERAVSTGREAANRFLLVDRVRLARIMGTSLHGPGLL